MRSFVQDEILSFRGTLARFPWSSGADFRQQPARKVFIFNNLRSESHRLRGAGWVDLLVLFITGCRKRAALRAAVVLELWVSKRPCRSEPLGPPQIGTSVLLSPRRLDCIMNSS